MSPLIQRFLRYIRFDTQSDPNSVTCPSTQKQKLFGAALVEEMRALGIADAHMDDNGFVYGTVPGDPSLPTIGLIAHMDTSPECSGANVKARIVHYTGQDICLNEEKQIYLRQADYPHLARDMGKHLIVTDGTTLLGGDDKAGIAEIMTAAELLLQSPEQHATLKIAFTPDEEIGSGIHRFDVATFAADYAYTVDGGNIGELGFENFNACNCTAQFTGYGIHPSTAKDVMINSQYVAMEFQSMLPVAQKPEHTQNYEGFIHLVGMEGNVDSSTLQYIIRDFDMAGFQKKKADMASAAAFLNAKYGDGTVKLTLKDVYYNMRQQIESRMHIMERAKKAVEAFGFQPRLYPMRGGTDGSTLSFMGLPCPAFCAAGSNYHSVFEYAQVEDMETITQMLVHLLTHI